MGKASVAVGRRSRNCQCSIRIRVPKSEWRAHGSKPKVQMEGTWIGHLSARGEIEGKWVGVA